MKCKKLKYPNECGAHDMCEWKMNKKGKGKCKVAKLPAPAAEKPAPEDFQRQVLIPVPSVAPTPAEAPEQLPVPGDTEMPPAPEATAPPATRLHGKRR